MPACATRIGGRGLVVLASVCGLALFSAARAARAEESPARACALGPGVHALSLEVDGRERRYAVSVGPQAARGAPPVLFLWHGFGGNAGEMLSLLDPARDWPEGIAVAPSGLKRRIEGRGTQRLPGWQLAAGELGDRDLHFFDAILEALAAQSCLDRARVYSAGLSNGAYFSHLLGCQRGSALAAIAPIAGGGPYPARCSAPLAVLIVHGRRDDVVPFSAARQSLETWAAVNRCESVPEELPTEGCATLAPCSRPVALCSHRGGHFWPDGTTATILSFVRGLAALERGAAQR